jgi:hypothetical protein
MGGQSTGTQGGIDKGSCVVLKDGKFDLTSRPDLDNILTDVGEQKSKPLVVHFHGGLVGLQSGLSGAAFLKSKYEDAGGRPVFFVWESGWTEVLEQNLPKIFNEAIFRQLLLRITQFAKAKLSQSLTPAGLGGKGIGLLHVDQPTLETELAKAQADAVYEPFQDIDPDTFPVAQFTQAELLQVQSALQSDVTLQMQASAIASSMQAPVSTTVGGKGIRVQESSTTLMSPSVLKEMRSPADSSKGLFGLASVRIIGGAVKTLIRIVDRFSTHRDHGFYKTIVEEILREFYVDNAGQFFWNGMKKETVDAFGPDDQVFGGTAFLKGLATLNAAGKLPQRVVLVGHSAGSIYICHFLENARIVLPTTTFEVLLVAPACTFEQLNKTISSSSGAIGRLRVFGMSDDVEQADVLVPVLYPSSLLYFVSGLLEDEPDKPILGMQRYYSGKSPYATAQITGVTSTSEFVKPNALDWAQCTSGPGCDCDMKSHGGIDKAAALISSLQYIIQNGF